MSTWKVLEEFYRAGRARSIGVSNFGPHQLRRLLRESEVIPAADQFEHHPFLGQDELRAFCGEHGIAIEAWSPLGRGQLLTDPEVRLVAGQAGKTPAQVVLRWHIQHGHVVFPKSVNPERIKENFDIFDFELSAEQMEIIGGLNRNERVGPDPDTFAG